MPKPSSSSLQPPTPTQAPPTPSRAPLTQFLTRPSKWFSRSVSAPRVSSGDESPRASTSSLAPAVRKPKISRPTDPRPILDVEGYMGVPGSRSVFFCVYYALGGLARPPGCISAGGRATSPLHALFAPSRVSSHHNLRLFTH
ncbi:hypothetical protein C8F04DRAFT_1094429 [Mycena alexandri]|uniref:Uncharacterized protein n=1 Tax=Mycena alexandri TaxID=1745969 RepID=A0AAD6T2P7_9AGAR|nr:hypothetical protein C8F04DRAFT_1094429 [Mycena alexandri]